MGRDSARPSKESLKERGFETAVCWSRHALVPGLNRDIPSTPWEQAVSNQQKQLFYAARARSSPASLRMTSMPAGLQ
jgi:hypothetical protein